MSRRALNLGLAARRVLRGRGGATGGHVALPIVAGDSDLVFILSVVGMEAMKKEIREACMREMWPLLLLLR